MTIVALQSVCASGLSSISDCVREHKGQTTHLHVGYLVLFPLVSFHLVFFQFKTSLDERIVVSLKGATKYNKFVDNEFQNIITICRPLQGDL